MDDWRRRVPGALDRIVAGLDSGSSRPGQQAMAAAVAEAIEGGTTLLVEAPTGTGKTFAYLVPALLSGRRVVVATATKALQEQLVNKDLPLLRRALGIRFEAALLKGRSNYLCRAALADVSATADPAQGALVEERVDRRRLADVLEWAARTESGDRADLPVAVRDGEWARLSVGVGECPGAVRCAHGSTCFAEQARTAAADADVIVVNTHLYGLHLASGATLLPEHDVVVVDEAHALEDIAADTLGTVLGPGRVAALAGSCRAVFTPDHAAAGRLEVAAVALNGALEGRGGRRVDAGEDDLAAALLLCGEAAAGAAEAARALDVGGDVGSRRDRLLQLASGVAADARTLAGPAEGSVTWVTTGPVPVLRRAPVDVGAELAERLFSRQPAVLTSATLRVGGSFAPLAARLGLPASGAPWEGLAVESPFDPASAGLLYCAAHLPDPRAAGAEAAVLSELEALIMAAGGRTLALFTSRRAMEAAAVHLADLPFRVLVQDELPRPVLAEAFVADETSVLLATLGFWQGFDAPGPTCTLVAIDRLPFGRPDDPVASARREAAVRARHDPFAAVDLPAAAVLLAQGAGRLLRTAEDRGVVAVLDRRLATAPYRWTLVNSLPPFRRTKDPDEARRFLAELAAERP